MPTTIEVIRLLQFAARLTQVGLELLAAGSTDITDEEIDAALADLHSNDEAWAAMVARVKARAKAADAEALRHSPFRGG